MAESLPPDAPATPQDPPDPLSTPVVMTVTSTDRTRADQIRAVLARAQEKHEPLRIRLPVTLYDYADARRGYVFLRDTAWNIQLQSGTLEDIEDWIEVLGRCVEAIAKEGSQVVREKLERQL